MFTCNLETNTRGESIFNKLKQFCDENEENSVEVYYVSLSNGVLDIKGRYRNKFIASIWLRENYTLFNQPCYQKT